MIEDLALGKQNHSGGLGETSNWENPDTQDTQNKTSYFGFRVSSEFQTERRSPPAQSRDQLSGSKKELDSPYTPISQ
jgi:hypothetical protein